ncbi:olfactory receptor 7E178-like [Oryctolagus cuniculus]|uniref:olfactory receptor 7E178-like n=1 Tax=Oryctolagus cuniculus TaxID=9986 RepID=UPI003879FAEC
MGFSEDPALQPLLFGLFLSMYLITVLGNLLIALAISSDSHLQTPMYFFLCNLSLADVGFTSTMVPKMIVDIHTHSTVISYVGFLTQMSLFIIFGCMGDLLLTVMAYDRFVTICHPLHYQVITNPCHCGFFPGPLWPAFGIPAAEFDGINSFKDVDISNFFCEPSQLLTLTCSDTFTHDTAIDFVDIIYSFLPISGIIHSYYKIISHILRVPSVGGMYKAFSTCGSHVTVECAVASVMYTVVIPLLNAFIYSLRNRDIKRAMWRLLHQQAI